MSDAIEIHGFCDEGFLPLKEAFEANFADGLELGASLAATHQGRMVCDLWAGWADAARTRPWTKDTIVRLFSTTKIPLIFCLLKLIDDGKVDLDAPVARYWPEFAAGGKDKACALAEVPATGGYGNARSIAGMGAIAALGGRWKASGTSPKPSCAKRPRYRPGPTTLIWAGSIWVLALD